MTSLVAFGNVHLGGLVAIISFENLAAGVIGSLVFGLIGIALLLAGYWLFDLITPKIDVQKELCEKNLAVAIVVAALLMSIAYVVASVVSA
jgi:uncharacterized membrane protein YjfL (UPF0719 family)